jgi:hypothetical protein
VSVAKVGVLAGATGGSDAGATGANVDEDASVVVATDGSPARTVPLLGVVASTVASSAVDPSFVPASADVLTGTGRVEAVWLPSDDSSPIDSSADAAADVRGASSSPSLQDPRASSASNVIRPIRMRLELIGWSTSSGIG